MPAKRRPPTLKRAPLVRALDRQTQRVYQHNQLLRLWEALLEEGILPENTRKTDFFLWLYENGLDERQLQAGSYKGATRHIWKEATPFEVAASLRPNAYLTHSSALFLHGLTQQIPSRIYVNKEQSLKPAPQRSALLQDAIDRAFSRPQRSSQYIFRFEETDIILLSGKHTERLEVGSLDDRLGIPLPVTKVERTLIDITVRPLYAGGIYQVLEAYRAAKDRVSARVLLATLKKLDYAYPYHQAIGFYMERAGYDARTINLFRSLEQPVDFYLTYGMTQKVLDTTWRLYHPENF